MAKKKIILFIVEGINDKTCLEGVLEEILDSGEVLFKLTDGDVLTSFKYSASMTPKNIVGQIVKEFKDKNHLTPGNFLEVVHIVDMDGAYLEDTYIHEDASAVDPLYKDDGIYTNDVDGIKRRNEMKRHRLDGILEIKKVLGNSVPYSVYFFSSNMDHVLHCNANLSEKDKDDKADKFDLKYSENPDAFLDFIVDNSFAIRGDYKKSWDFIKADKNSVRRYSNFAIYLEKSGKVNTD